MGGPAAHLDLRFRLLRREGRARAGVFETPHGKVFTPAFVPVASRAALKCLTPELVEDLAPAMLLGNAYHLMQRPGADHVARLGGLHGFTKLQLPWITDSGGYQVFSLGEQVRVDEEGVTFRSHLDGRRIRLEPEDAVRIQEALGADLILALDHCLALPAPHRDLAAAVDRTTRWTLRALKARTRTDQAFVGIVQGGTEPDLRAGSARALAEMDLPAYAVGGLAVGEKPALLRATLEVVDPLLPSDRPRHLMGVGAPLDLLDGIDRGMDLFDCSLPSRNGRRGWLLTHDGWLRIGTLPFAGAAGPVDEECACSVCRRLDRGYLRHLFGTGEPSALVLGTLHNVHFLLSLLRRARAEILRGTFAAFAQRWRRRWEVGTAKDKAHQAEDPDGALRSRAARRREGPGEA